MKITVFLKRCARNIGSGWEYEIFSGSGRISENLRFSNLSGFSKESGFPKELGFGKELKISLNNWLKSTSSTVSKGRRSKTIIRTIPSVISFGLTIFRVSFCTCDKFYIDSVYFLVHIHYVHMHMLQMA